MQRLVAVAGLLAALTSALPAERQVRHRSHAVTMERMKFEPATITASVGDTIVWKNRDAVSHTAATTAARTFDTKEIKPGEVARWVVKRPGRYEYHCAFHPTMTAVVVIK